MAVYTEVPDRELAEFVGGYDIGAVVSCEGMEEGIENTNYLLRTDRDTYVLTIYERRVKRADLPYFLGLMEHLSAGGIDCPTPVHGIDGEALRTLCGKPAAIVSFLAGTWPRRPMPAHCARLGAALARMHLAGAGFPLSRANDLSLDGWRALHETCRGRADEVGDGLAAEIGDALGALEERWPSGLPRGNIHADLFPDNVFFLDDRLSGVIDFYFACTDFLAYDLAVCLNAWCFEPDGQFDPARSRALIAGYDGVRTLEAAERKALPVLCRGAALRFLLTRLSDRLFPAPGVLVRPKDPLEFLSRLRFHRGVDGPDAYGVE